MREYKTERRNGYHAVDEFKDGRCTRMVVAVNSGKTAELIAGGLGEAYRQGQLDAKADTREGLDQILARLDLYIPGLSYQETADKLLEEL